MALSRKSADVRPRMATAVLLQCKAPIRTRGLSLGEEGGEEEAMAKPWGWGLGHTPAATFGLFIYKQQILCVVSVYFLLQKSR